MVDPQTTHLKKKKNVFVNVCYFLLIMKFIKLCCLFQNEQQPKQQKIAVLRWISVA